MPLPSFFSPSSPCSGSPLGIIVRRLHDTGHSGTRIALVLLGGFASLAFAIIGHITDINLISYLSIPIIVFVLVNVATGAQINFIMTLFEEGDSKPNQYGPPRRVSKHVKKKK